MKENKDTAGAGEMKRCSSCKEYKPRAKFYKNRAQKDGYANECKPCKSAQLGVKNYGRNKKVVALREQGKKRCITCKLVKDFGEFHKNNVNPDGHQQYCKECIRGDKKRKEKQKEYCKENRERIRAKQNEYYKERYHSDPSYRLYKVVKSRINKGLKNWEGYKNSRYFSALGYTPEDLVRHIESQWKEEWNWDNYGEVWVIDHIYPHSKLPYDSLEHPNYKKAWALSNLRPLCIKENAIKSDKILVE